MMYTKVRELFSRFFYFAWPTSPPKTEVFLCAGRHPVAIAECYKQPAQRGKLLVAATTLLLAFFGPLHVTPVVANSVATNSVTLKPSLREAALALRNAQYNRAHQLFSIIAQRDNSPLAQYTLGLLAENGWEKTKPNALHACQWYQKAAQRDHAKSMLKLGHCLKADILPLPPIAKTANANDQVTAYKPANEGAHSPQALDEHKAAFWYKKAADHGMTEALCHLGELYRTGQGVEVNTSRALQLCFHSAKSGSTWAQRMVAEHFAQQSHFDFAQAAYWYQQAATNGDGKAAYALAELYHSNPRIVTERFNLSERTHEDLARDWYEVAAGLGIKSAYPKTAVLYYQALNKTLNNPQKKLGAPTDLLAKTYVWLRASHIAHTPASANIKRTEQDRQISLSVLQKLKKILPLMPKSWLPDLESKVAAHFGKYPVRWPTNTNPTPETAQLAQRSDR